MTSNVATSLLIAALLGSTGADASDSVAVRQVEGNTWATFTLGSFDCVLVDDTIRCTPASQHAQAFGTRWSPFKHDAR